MRARDQGHPAAARAGAALVVAGALAVVYLIVVPSLETELVNAKLDQLEEDARARSRAAPDDSSSL